MPTRTSGFVGGRGFAARLLLGVILAGVFAGQAWSKDYVVRFVEETYKNAPAAEGTPAKIYHTWAVETDFGKKLLVLKGEDAVQREWLREFAKDHEQFLVKVAEIETGAFELNTVVDIAVEKLHPISASFTETTTDKDKKSAKAKKK